MHYFYLIKKVTSILSIVINKPTRPPIYSKLLTKKGLRTFLTIGTKDRYDYRIIQT